MDQKRKPSKNKDIHTVCFCNFVSKSKIENAIRNGCHSLNQIYDATNAGVGPCGGTCRVYLARMLESYLQHGKFPDNPRPPPQKKSRR